MLFVKLNAVWALLSAVAAVRSDMARTPVENQFAALDPGNVDANTSTTGSRTPASRGGDTVQVWVPKAPAGPADEAPATYEACVKPTARAPKNLEQCEALCARIGRMCVAARWDEAQEVCCLQMRATPKTAPQTPTTGKAEPWKRPAADRSTSCNRGSGIFEYAGLGGAPRDCQGPGMRFGVEGVNPLNAFGLRWCFDSSVKSPRYVQYVIRKDRNGTGYDRSGIMFKENPRFSICEQTAPSWWGCVNRNSCPRADDDTPNERLDRRSCIQHNVQPNKVCNKAVFSGKQCSTCPNHIPASDCDKVKDTCMRYSAYDNAVCEGWAEDNDYDRGHMAAASDTFDWNEAVQFCDRVGGVDPLGWSNPYDLADFIRTEWHKANYSKCAFTASFFMINVVPQGSLFNQGCWQDIEQMTKHYAARHGVDLKISVGISKAGRMRGQLTPLDGPYYNESSEDNMRVADYMWKVVCRSDGEEPFCTAWVAANRNIPVTEGCRTPLTLAAMRRLLSMMGELTDDGEIPGLLPEFHGTKPGLLPDVELKCDNKHHPERCELDGAQGPNWGITGERTLLTAVNGSLQLSCSTAEDCGRFCHCCDEAFLSKLERATTDR